MKAILTFLRKVWPYIVAHFSALAVSAAASVPVRVAVLFAWSVFLAAFWTAATGNLTISVLKENITSSPFASAPVGSLALADAAFPVSFAFSLTVAYISFRFTITLAAVVMSRTIKALFGG